MFVDHESLWCRYDPDPGRAKHSVIGCTDEGQGLTPGRGGADFQGIA